MMMKMMLIEDLNDDDNEDDNYDINDDDDESEGSWVVSYNLCSIISHLTPTTFIKLPFDGQLIFSLEFHDIVFIAESFSSRSYQDNITLSLYFIYFTHTHTHISRRHSQQCIG